MLKQRHTCPWCGSALILRHGPYGEFYGCLDFPKCTYSESAAEFQGIRHKSGPSGYDEYSCDWFVDMIWHQEF